MKKISRLIFSAIVTICLCGIAVAQDSNLVKQNHPDRYVVKKGDTLWDIAGLFLHKPWLWPEIWQVNPQIANPHLIYPGDELELVYLDGKPYLRHAGDGKLSPRVRETPWDGAIPAIPVDMVAPFLSRAYVVDAEEMRLSPYVVAFADEHIVAGAGQRIYVRKIQTQDHLKYNILRLGKPYKDAETGELLGHEGLFIGVAELQRTGDPATLFVASAEQEVLPGDRLVPAFEEEATGDFYPKQPDRQVNGAIISVLNGVTQIGQYNIVALDRGARDGLSPGTVLQVDHRGERIRDRVARDQATFKESVMRGDGDPDWDKITLPDEPAGLLMVFRSFERVSFAIIMDATRAIHVHDRIHNP